jgi:hypothetical protein
VLNPYTNHCKSLFCFSFPLLFCSASTNASYFSLLSFPSSKTTVLPDPPHKHEHGYLKICISSHVLRKDFYPFPLSPHSHTYHISAWLYIFSIFLFLKIQNISNRLNFVRRKKICVHHAFHSSLEGKRS